MSGVTALLYDIASIIYPTVRRNMGGHGVTMTCDSSRQWDWWSRRVLNWKCSMDTSEKEQPINGRKICYLGSEFVPGWDWKHQNSLDFWNRQDAAVHWWYPVTSSLCIFYTLTAKPSLRSQENKACHQVGLGLPFLLASLSTCLAYFQNQHAKHQKDLRWL